MGWFDYLVRLLPALAIIGGLIGARMQLAENRRQSAIAIAKKHYREMLEQFQNNTDVLYGGMNEEAMTALEKDVVNYRRYRILFTQMVFAVQEVYFALDPKRNEHWRTTSANWILMFKYFIVSEARFTPMMRTGLDKRFISFMLKTISERDHPLAHSTIVGTPVGRAADAAQFPS